MPLLTLCYVKCIKEMPTGYVINVISYPLTVRVVGAPLAQMISQPVSSISQQVTAGVNLN